MSKKSPNDIIWYHNNNPIDIWTLARAWQEYNCTDIHVTEEMIAAICTDDSSPILLDEEQLNDLAEGVTRLDETAQPQEDDIHEYKLKLLQRDIFTGIEGSQECRLDLPKLVTALRARQVDYPPKLDGADDASHQSQLNDEPQEQTNTLQSATIPEIQTETEISIRPYELLLATVENPTRLMRIMCEAHYFIHYEDSDKSYAQKGAGEKELFIARRFNTGKEEAKHIRLLISETPTPDCTNHMIRAILAHHLLWLSAIGKKYRDQPSRRKAVETIFSETKNIAEAIVNIVTPEDIKKGGLI